jgi:alginate O-acetyltransferase complex protein AlgI
MQADRIFLLPAADLTTPVAWLGAVCFSLQIYYDFSGYSDMAIGLGRMFGFRFPENFNYPYISRSMREFWRRWHISLSTWLRDYLYIPLGGNRGGTARTLANLVVVFALCGLWHGASWTFVAWGMWHGLFLVIERLVPGRRPSALAAVGGWLYASLVVLAGWVVFRSASLPEALGFLKVMAGGGGAAGNLLLGELMSDAKFKTELVAGLVLSTPVHALIRQRAERPALEPEPTGRETAALVMQDSLRLLVFCTVGYFSALTIAARAYHPFLYFQF